MTHKEITWQRGGKAQVWDTYAKLHEGKIGQHWIWSAIARSFGGGGHRNAAGFETDIQTLMGWLK